MPRPGANPAAKTEQRSFEGITLWPATHEPLLDDRSGLASQWSQHVGIHGDHTPPFGRQTKAAGFLLTEPARLIATLRFSGQENHSQAAGSIGLRPDGFEVRPRNFTEHPGAIAGVAIPAASPAVLHAAKPPQCLAQNPMAGFPGQLRQKPDSTGILLTRDRLRCNGVAKRPRCSNGMDGVGHEHQPDGRMSCSVNACRNHLSSQS